ncbi:pyridoxal-phosphate dependent enzyme [Nocardia jiangsuensis]|uniref:Pyridoxal-phosphate dependent enzyme n=1 Tax=Nocardia jiangsuensis TaxID=1691563 RepID=A0ABV8DZ93_9NOCA
MTAVGPRGAGVYESVDAAIGNTPLVRLNRVTEGITATVSVELEYLNPGGSVKDRAARGMIDAAEAAGALRPGGVVVEATSGNTGIGLVAIAAARGYRTIVVVPDKSSREKVALLRAYGAAVHVAPVGLPVGHPEHIRSIALNRPLPRWNGRATARCCWCTRAGRWRCSVRRSSRGCVRGEDSRR